MNERIETVLPPQHLIDDARRDWPTDDPADRRKVVQQAAAHRVMRQLKQDPDAFERRLEDEKRAHDAEHELVLRIKHAGYVRLVKAAFADMIESFIDEIRREISTEDMHPSVLEAVSAGDGMEAKAKTRAVVMQEHTVGDAAEQEVTSTLYESKWMRRPDERFRFVVSRRLLARRGIHAQSLPSALEPEFHADTLLQEALEMVARPELPPEDEWDETIQRHAEQGFRIRIAEALLTSPSFSNAVKAHSYTPRQSTIDKVREVIEVHEEKPYASVGDLEEAINQIDGYKGNAVMRQMRRVLENLEIRWTDGDAYSFVNALRTAYELLQDTSDTG